jgi:hypothetical protein
MRRTLCTAILAAASTTAAAQDITVTVENTLPDGGLQLTPFWLGLHDGSFDVYNGNETINPAFPFTESLAELGATADITAAFAATSPTGVDTTLASNTPPAPFGPGESASFTFSNVDPSNRYLSYASMIVPSNDLFVANGNPFAHEVFDAMGNFTGPFTIEIFEVDILDAGTEKNDVLDGPAFVINQDGTLGTSQNQVVKDYFVLEPGGEYLNTLIGVVTPGGTITNVPVGDESLIARITVVPEPATAGVLLGMGGLMLLRRRKA